MVAIVYTHQIRYGPKQRIKYIAQTILVQWEVQETAVPDNLRLPLLMACGDFFATLYTGEPF